MKDDAVEHNKQIMVQNRSVNEAVTCTSRHFC